LCHLLLHVDAKGLYESFQALDESQFATHLAEFDAVIRLDAWKTKILLVGKRRLAELRSNEELGLGDGGGGAGGGGEDDDVL
jgi:hypothetical protein